MFIPTPCSKSLPRKAELVVVKASSASCFTKLICLKPQIRKITNSNTQGTVQTVTKKLQLPLPLKKKSMEVKA